MVATHKVLKPPTLPSATRDQYYATANIYDASGNRAWKLGGEVNWMWNNGQGWQAYGDLNLRTWYQSDLVTITDQAMTKHYFIAGQRIASKLTESLQPEVVQALKDKPVTPLSGDVNELGTNMTERLRRDFECVGLDYNAFYPGETRLEALENLLNVPEQPAEYQVFFYHSDHLGSSSFITDINGDATQHLQYLPFGEDFVHQQNTAAYYTPYTFSGKERDMETSLSYFGARYYEAGLSVWLSVDPMSDKAPGWTPYRYGFQNPMKFIDPTGLLETETGGDPPAQLPIQPTLKGIGYKPPQNATSGSGQKNLNSRSTNSGPQQPTVNSETSAIVGAASATAEGLEQVSSHRAANPSVKYSQSVNGKVRSPEVLTRTTRIQANSLSNQAKFVGRGLNVAGVAIAGVNLFTTENRNGADYARFGGAVLISATAAIPVAGPLISFSLGVADSYGAFDGLYNSFK